jgi:uncharacterized protein (TIGR00369 family)
MTKILPPNPNFKAYLEEKLQRQFFMKHVGFEVTRIEAGEVEVQLQVLEKHLQQNYFLHGGVLMTAADLVMGFSAYTLCEEGTGVVTADLNIQFFRPGVGDTLIAKGKVIKPGRAIHFCEASIYVQKGDDEPVLTNKASSSMAVIQLRQ